MILTAICTSCFTYSVPLLYWPPFSGGCTPCLQDLTYRVADPQSRIWLTVCSAPLSRSFILVYTSVMLLCYFHSGYDGGPVPSFVSVYLFRGLWTCRVYGSKLLVCLSCKYVWIVGLSHLCDCYMYMIWLLGGRTAAVTLSARLCICYMICISVGFAVILFFRWLVTKTKETLSKFLQNE